MPPKVFCSIGGVGVILDGTGESSETPIPHCSPRSCAYSISILADHSHLQPNLGSSSNPGEQARLHYIDEKQAHASSLKYSSSPHSDESEV